MKRRLLALALIILCILPVGCAKAWPPAETQYTATFLTLFDTVTSIVGFAQTEEEFGSKTQAIHDELLLYHRLFDVYNEYEGLNNLKTINENAGIAPVKVDDAVIELLMDCREYETLTGGKVNAAMGSVLKIWHVARSNGFDDPMNAKLPDMEKLKDASGHIGFDAVEIDEEAGTVFIRDEKVQLDVGAIAKGWATQRAAEHAPEGMLISVGGNVCATGPKDEAGTPWVVGILNPEEPGENLHTVYLDKGTVVTSGDYQRAYYVDGKRYHHIIDPVTLMPGAYWRSVTVICEDSGLADALSTALFLMPLEEGMQLAEACNAKVLWVGFEGEEHMTQGFEAILRT